LSREAMTRWRQRLMSTGQIARMGLGGALVAIGALVLFGLDKRIETGVTAASPQWLTDVTTRF
jgi:cytochrome c-type biogenesis protein